MLPQNLKQLRTNNKMTQKNLADVLGVSLSSVAMWEAGKRSPDNEMLIKIAELFNVSIDSLLGRYEFDFKVDVESDRLGYMSEIDKLRNAVIQNFDQALSGGAINEDQAKISLQIFDHTLTVMIESNKNK